MPTLIIPIDNGIHSWTFVHITTYILKELISMSHSHSHDHHSIIHDHIHAQQHMHEYRNYRYLFIVGSIGAIAEFLIALVLAHSVSAQADAIHALTHVSLYALAWLVTRQIVMRGMNAHQAYHHHEKFLNRFALLIFAGLAWICYMSISKLTSPETIVSSYMLTSVSVGLCANIIALKILNRISKFKSEVASKHKTHRLLSLDTWGDFAFSVIVLITSLVSLLRPALPIHIIDPIISFGAIGWIGWSGVRILRDKKI